MTHGTVIVVVSPTTMTMRHLEADGWLPCVVERRVGPNTHDLFGFIDVLAVRGADTLAVQCTSDNGGNVSARVRKIADHPNVGAVRDAGWRIVVHGWRADGRLREVDVS